MYWNYRVLRKVQEEEPALYIVEVYYKSDDSNIIGWTKPEAVRDENLDQLRESLAWMAEALEKPVLDEVDLLQRAEEMEALGADIYEIGLDPLGQWENDGGTR